MACMEHGCVSRTMHGTLPSAGVGNVNLMGPRRQLTMHTCKRVNGTGYFGKQIVEEGTATCMGRTADPTYLKYLPLVGTCMSSARFAWDATMAARMHGRLPRQHVATKHWRQLQRKADRTKGLTGAGRALQRRFIVQSIHAWLADPGWPGKCAKAAGTVARACNSKGPHT
jgi:hypothetical protein